MGGLGVRIPQGALWIGVLITLGTFFAVSVMKHKLGYDDALDAFGIHGFGGILGGILTGIFFNNQIFSGESQMIPQVLIQLNYTVAS